MTQTWTRRLGAAISLTCCTMGMAQAQSNPIAHLAVGDLSGVTQNGVAQFRGIPYAEPPVGALRWVAPQPAKAWSGVRDASQFGAACPQQIPDPFGGSLPTSEDCLSLNVYMPTDGSPGPHPVIVWIPGGGQVMGASSQYDASRLAQVANAVVVTMNYRLGALGWLWTSGMVAENKGHNFSIQDQQEAMRWVKRHVGAFNGDASRITMAGQSVGSISASLHLVSPTAAGLFHRAMLLSGINPPGLLTSAKAAEVGDAFAVKVGCPAGPEQMSCLRSKTPDALLAASSSYVDIGRDGLGWQNFIDGEMITSDVFTALSKGNFNKVPLMLGTTKDEGKGFIPVTFDMDGSAMTQDEYVSAATTFIGSGASLLTNLMYPSSKLGSPGQAWSQVVTDGWFACEVNEVARRASAQVPTYAYEFADRTAPKFLRDPYMTTDAFHAGDLLYWFQTPIAGAPLTLNPAQKRLSDQMMRYWKRFAESGQPNEAGSADPVWLKYNGLSTPYLTLVPDAISTQQWGAFQRAHQCTAWSLLYSLRSLGGV
jgi:para-nitrobenzyl esterase